MGKLFSKSKPNKYGNFSPVSSSMTSTPGQAAWNSPTTIKQYPPVHTDAVMCVANAGTGHCLSGSKDKSMVLFDYNQGSVDQTWKGHNKEVTRVTYAPLLDSYFSCSRDTIINMWQKNSPDPVLQFRGHDLVVNGLSLSSDNKQLCSGSRDNSIRLWCVDTGQCLLQNSVTRNLITHVTWAKEASFIAQTGEDKEVRIWDAHNLKVAQVFPKKQYIQTCCDISDDNNYCVTSSNGFQGQGCEATLWDIRTDRIVHEFKGHMETVCACVFVPYGGRKFVVTSSNDCSVRVWDRDTTECVASVHIPVSGPLTSLAVNEQNILCVSSFNSGIHLLDLSLLPEGLVHLNDEAQF